MSRRTTTVIVFAVLLVAAAAMPAAVTAQTAESTLTVDVTQDADGDVTVTVADNGTAVENATVSVDTADANETYAGEGAHVTDANGTVALPSPNASVSVVVTAVSGDQTASTTVDLEAPSLDVAVEQDGDAVPTVSVIYAIGGDPVDGADVTVSTVDENDSYAGTGDYDTDENGSVELPAPDEPVQVEVLATAENLSGSATVELQNASSADQNESAFGQRVSAFVHSLLSGDEHERQLGLLIAQWVTANNPGNAPDHAGPPDDVGPDDGEGEDADDDDRENGPPDHAADERDDVDDDDREEAEGEDNDDDDADDDDDDDDDRGGPPDHAGSNGNGNGR